MGNVIRWMETQRKNWKEMLEIKNSVKMKNIFDGIMTRLDTDEERIMNLNIGQ